MLSAVTPAEIRAIPEAAERARQAQAYIERGREALTVVRGIRDAAIAEWCKTETQRVVAEQLTVTAGLIGQIITNRRKLR